MQLVRLCCAKQVRSTAQKQQNTVPYFSSTRICAGGMWTWGRTKSLTSCGSFRAPRSYAMCKLSGNLAP